MIVSDLSNVDHQAAMTPALERALAFLRLRDLRHLPDGKIEIEGDSVFALIQRYDTVRTEAPTFECHRKYIDVQYIASGTEIIGWTTAESIEIKEAYDAGKDICFGVASGRWTSVQLSAGQLAILYPEDAHAPKIAAGASTSVTKIVIKVAV